MGTLLNTALSEIVTRIAALEVTARDMPGIGWCEQLAFVTPGSSFQDQVSGEPLSFTGIITVVPSRRNVKDTNNSCLIEIIYTFTAIP